MDFLIKGCRVAQNFISIICPTHVEEEIDDEEKKDWRKDGSSVMLKINHNSLIRNKPLCSKSLCKCCSN